MLTCVFHTDYHWCHPVITLYLHDHFFLGLAVADLVYGRTSPAGRLPFSWPTTATDVPPEEDYTMEGRTYRYRQQNVKWSFGHGK